MEIFTERSTFTKHAYKHGIKPIIGCELYVAPKEPFRTRLPWIGEIANHLIVLAKICKGKKPHEAVYRRFLTVFITAPIDKELLAKHHGWTHRNERLSPW